jgi:hypothetical protein
MVTVERKAYTSTSARATNFGNISFLLTRKPKLMGKPKAKPTFNYIHKDSDLCVKPSCYWCKQHGFHATYKQIKDMKMRNLGYFFEERKNRYKK